MRSRCQPSSRTSMSGSWRANGAPKETAVLQFVLFDCLLGMPSWYIDAVALKEACFNQGKPRYKVRGYNKKYDCYPCQTNKFKYNPSDNTMETEVSLRLATLRCTYEESRDGVRDAASALLCFAWLRRLKSGGYWENTLTEKMDVQAPDDRSTLYLGRGHGIGHCRLVCLM